MKVLKEKVLATRGNWVIKARLIEFKVQGERGLANRVELFLDKMGPEEIGFSEEDLVQLHAMLVKFRQEVSF